MSVQILLVEDTPSLQSYYAALLRREGWSVAVSGTAAEARRLLAAEAPQIAILDVMLPDASGLDVMREALARNRATRFIVMTADNSVHRAVDAMHGGASDFLVKPFDDGRLVSTARAILEAPPRAVGQKPQLAARIGTARPEAPAQGEFIGSSAAIIRLREAIGSVARSRAPVFISGESGTGKELCARAIHCASLRATAPFVPLNCGAICPDDADEAIFGAPRDGAMPGFVAQAEGGTLFLDEVGALAPPVQAKLLTFLETSRIHPPGADRPLRVDVRIISATNCDPLELVRRGRLREDLFYRLHVVPMQVPALREREDDVIEIAADMLVRFSREEGRAFDAFAPDAIEVLRRHSWPGNVRELSNVLRAVVLLNEGPLVTAEMLPRVLADAAPPSGAPPVNGASTLAEIERAAIEAAIQRCGGSVPRAAQILDVAPSTLYRKRDAWIRHENPGGDRTER